LHLNKKNVYVKGSPLIEVFISDCVLFVLQLTPQEKEKKERRKEQNRRAARKCRAKKKILQNLAANVSTERSALTL
jgi:hypothetical protein